MATVSRTLDRINMISYLVRVSTISGEHLEDFTSWTTAEQACRENKWNLPVPGHVLMEKQSVPTEEDTDGSSSSGLDTDSDSLPDLEALIDAVQDLQIASRQFSEGLTSTKQNLDLNSRADLKS